MIRAFLRLPRVLIGLLRGDDLFTFAQKLRGRRRDSERDGIDAMIDMSSKPWKVEELRQFAAKRPGEHEPN